MGWRSWRCVGGLGTSRGQKTKSPAEIIKPGYLFGRLFFGGSVWSRSTHPADGESEEGTLASLLGCCPALRQGLLMWMHHGPRQPRCKFVGCHKFLGRQPGNPLLLNRTLSAGYPRILQQPVSPGPRLVTPMVIRPWFLVMTSHRRGKS